MLLLIVFLVLLGLALLGFFISVLISAISVSIDLGDIFDDEDDEPETTTDD